MHAMVARCEYSSLRLPADRTYIEVAGAYVREVSRKMGFDDADLGRIERAVAEAVGNVVDHAYEPFEREPFEVSCERVPAGIKVVVKDRGIPFDPEQVSSPSSSGEPSGLMLMRALMDEVSIHLLGREGKEIHLVKYLRGKSIEDYVQACELDRYESPPSTRVPVEKSLDFQVRLMRPSEAIEVAKAAYKAYGYSYFYPQIYYPDRMVELNRSGNVISAVALTQDGDFAGHCSLFRSDSGSPVAELGQAVVKPSYRGHGCLATLTEYIIEEARNQCITGLYIRAVTNHTFSQRVSHRFGFRACAIMLGYAPSSVSFKHIRERLSQRETFVVEYLYLTAPERLELFPPPDHREFVGKLYANIGVTPLLGDPLECRQDFTSDRSVIETKSAIFEPEGFATIELKRSGSDVVTEVRSRLRELCVKRFDVIELNLDLADPGTCALVPAFEELGFFFGGILPGASGKDTLMLQYLNNVAVDYERIQLHSEVAREILAYVRDRDPNLIRDDSEA